MMRVKILLMSDSAMLIKMCTFRRSAALSCISPTIKKPISRLDTWAFKIQYDRPGVFVPPRLLVLSSQAERLRRPVVGPQDCNAGGPRCSGSASVRSRSALLGVCRTTRRSTTAPASLLGDPKLPTGFDNRHAFAGFQVNRPQMLNDLFGGVPFFRHDVTSLVRSSLTLELDQISPAGQFAGPHGWPSTALVSKNASSFPISRLIGSDPVALRIWFAARS